MRTNKEIIKLFNANVQYFKTKQPLLPTNRREGKEYDSIIEVMNMAKREAIMEIADFELSQFKFLKLMIAKGTFKEREAMLEKYSAMLHSRKAKIKWV